MKARKLKHLLNDTGYCVNNNRDYIAVGSPMCHDLFKIDKKTLKLTYALDFNKEGRESLVNKTREGKENELLFIWDKLTELIETGQIQEIIDGNDEIENPISVFSVRDGELIEEFCEEDMFGYPHPTHTGYTMYNNTHFRTKEEAIEEAIEDYKCSVNIIAEGIKDLESTIKERKNRLNEYQGYVDRLNGLRLIKK